MSKIVLLNSGGFDSICLSHCITEYITGDTEVTSLFFNYGQKSLNQERKCVEKVCSKLNYVFNEIEIPKFTWTSNDFYSETFSGEKEYLEYRNLVFLSYALSYAESIGAEFILIATLKSLGYFDTSTEFFRAINIIAEAKGIKVITPFSDLDKVGLTDVAFKYQIKEGDFHSCDNPKPDGSVCGECPDCVTTTDILNYTKIDTPIKRWCHCFNPNDLDFQNLFREAPIYEMRVLTNNDCQLNCKHCYYQNNPLLGEKMTLDEYRRVFIEAKELGIQSYHFSGKEPLYDDTLFDIIEVLKEVNPEAVHHLVTNGINVPKYAEKLKEIGCSKVFLSVDDILSKSEYRGVKNVSVKALSALNGADIPTEVFIDLHIENYNKVYDIMEYLYNEFSVRDFYVRTSQLVGKSKYEIVKLTSAQLNIAFMGVKKFSERYTNTYTTFTVHAPYVYDLLDEQITEYDLYKDIFYTSIYANPYVLTNLHLHPEFYCGRFENQITLTPDGYIHGCGMEVCNREYSKSAPGNIRNEHLFTLISKGKEHSIKCNCNECENCKLKFFNCVCANPLTLS